jgi:hypothetical protein
MVQPAGRGLGDVDATRLAPPCYYLLRRGTRYRDLMVEDLRNPVGPLAEQYLHAVAEQDWSTVAASVSRQVVRHGPFGDDYEGVDDYLTFLKRIMPSLTGYRMDIDHINELGNRRALVELRETIVIEGGPVETHECLVFEMGLDGLLATISIYIRQSVG